MFTAIFAVVVIAAAAFGAKKFLERREEQRMDRLSAALKAKRTGVTVEQPESSTSFTLELPGGEAKRLAKRSAILRVCELGTALKTAYDADENSPDKVRLSEATARRYKAKINALIAEFGLTPKDCKVKSWSKITVYVEGIANSEAARIGDKCKNRVPQTKVTRDDRFDSNVRTGEGLELIGDEGRRLKTLEQQRTVRTLDNGGLPALYEVSTHNLREKRRARSANSNSVAPAAN